MAHPFYAEADAPDSATMEGAQRLCDRIKARWAEKGFAIQAWPEQEPFAKEMRGCYWVVRSDLVDALPRRAEQPE